MATWSEVTRTFQPVGDLDPLGVPITSERWVYKHTPPGVVQPFCENRAFDLSKFKARVYL
jgi:hypothetical protein